MHILLLGHPDIASIYALDRVIRKLPAWSFSVALSPHGKPPADIHPALQELAAVDAGLLQAYFAGDIEHHVPALPIRRAIELNKPNSSAGLDAMRQLAPDLVVSVRYRRILHAACIEIPRHGVINLHSGLLPDYRGVMATFWAMRASESEIGTTLHRIVDSGIDTGPIISRQTHPFRDTASYLSNLLNLYQAGTDAIVAGIEQVRNLRKLPRLPAIGGGRYYSEPGKHEVQKFLDSGLRLVDGSEQTLLTTLVSELRSALTIP